MTRPAKTLPKTVQGLKIAPREVTLTLTTEEGAVFHFQRCTEPVYWSGVAACVADERTGQVDNIEFTAWLARKLITGWEHVYDEDTGDAVDFSPDLIDFVPYDLRERMMLQATQHINARAKRLPADQQAAAQEVDLGRPLSVTSDSVTT